MRHFLTTFSIAILCFSCASQAFSFTAVPIAQQGTVDSDGDGVMDVVDNAPGTFNSDQTDTDNDGIGDAIDPTPGNSNPSLGDPGLGIYAPPSILPGGTASFPYTVLTTPPGAWGQILLDFDLDNLADAVAFGTLDTSIQTISIPANVFVGSSWDLYTPGTYTVAMKAFAPGMASQFWALPNVTVLPVPEPGTVALVALAGFCAAAGLCRGKHR
jgi:hypothetical protein